MTVRVSQPDTVLMIDLNRPSRNPNEYVVEEKLASLFKLTPAIRYTLDMKGILPTSDALSYFKYIDDGLHKVFMYIWEIFDGKYLLDVDSIVKLFDDKAFKESILGSDSTLMMILIYLLIVSQEKLHQNVRGVYATFTRENESYYYLRTYLKYDAVSDIRISSRNKLRDLRLTCSGCVFHDNFKEVTRTDEKGTIYEYTPQTLEGEPAFTYPNVITYPVIQDLIVQFNYIEYRVDITFRVYVFDGDIISKLAKPNILCQPVDKKRSLIYKRPPYLKIGCVSEGNLLNLTPQMISDLKGSLQGKRGLSESYSRKLAFLIGLHDKIGSSSSVYKAFNSGFGELKVLKLIFGFLPLLD